MKLTKSKLKQIIKEELAKVLREGFQEGDMVLAPDYNDTADETSVMVDGFTSEEAARAFVSALPPKESDVRGQPEVGPTYVNPEDDEYIPGGTHFASFSLSGDRRGDVKAMVDGILGTETKLWN